MGHDPDRGSCLLKRDTRLYAAGFNSGSDGTRTRDLRRDRPVMALAGWPGISGDLRREQGFRPSAFGSYRVWAGACGNVRRDVRGMQLLPAQQTTKCARNESAACTLRKPVPEPVPESALSTRENLPSRTRSTATRSRNGNPPTDTLTRTDVCDAPLKGKRRDCVVASSQ